MKFDPKLKRTLRSEARVKLLKALMVVRPSCFDLHLEKLMKELRWSLTIGTRNLTSLAVFDNELTRFTVFKKGDHYNVSEHDVDTGDVKYYDIPFDTESDAIASVEKEYLLRWEDKSDHYTGNDYGVHAYTGQKEWWDT